MSACAGNPAHCACHECCGGAAATLPNFLLARIAEDEQPTWKLAPYDCPPDCCAPAGWVGSQCRYCDVTPMYGGTVKAMTQSAEEHAETIHQRSRVLAECQAKRWIVEALAPYAGKSDPEWVESDDTLQCLASVYADHPDYRPEWRP